MLAICKEKVDTLNGTGPTTHIPIDSNTANNKVMSSNPVFIVEADKFREQVLAEFYRFLQEIYLVD